MIGQQVGPYKIIETLGAGGMGIVYKGLHLKLEQQVAIKVLAPPFSVDDAMRDRFEREAKLQAKLSHPNVTNILNYLEDNRNIYLVMEFIDGETLEKKLKNTKALPLVECRRIISDVLSALAYMHAKGIIHRDIKPGNIMLTRAGQTKVMDFGIAKIVGEKGYTKTGMLAGTVYYMSPEQIKGQELSTASDIYALGITLFQMITGQIPYKSDSEYEVMRAHVTSPVPTPSSINHDIPRDFDDLIIRAMAKEPRDRFSTSEEFIRALSIIDLNTVAANVVQKPELFFPAAEILLPSSFIPEQTSGVPQLHHGSTFFYRALIGILTGIIVCLLAGAMYFLSARFHDNQPTPPDNKPLSLPLAGPTHVPENSPDKIVPPTSVIADNNNHGGGNQDIPAGPVNTVSNTPNALPTPSMVNQTPEAVVDIRTMQPQSGEVREGVSKAEQKKNSKETATNPFAESIKTEKKVYAPYEEIVVNFSNLQSNTKNWISIAKPDAKPDSFETWDRPGGKKSGVIKFRGLRAGTYEVRYYYNWESRKYDYRAMTRFSIK